MSITIPGSSWANRTMGRLRCIVFMLCLCGGLAGTLCAVAAPAGMPEADFPGLTERVSVDLRGIDIVDALKFLAIKGQLNIVASKEVAGKVHLLMDDVTVGAALETILSVNKLAYVVKGGIVQIMSENEYQALTGTNFYDLRETKVYQLKYASAQGLATMLQTLKSERGEIVFNEGTGTLIIKDIPTQLAEMDRVVVAAEIPTLTRPAPTETRVFRLQYAKVADVQAEISKSLTEGLGMVQADKRTNTLIVTELPHRFKVVQEAIDAFDQKPREVYIDAKIVEVSLTDGFEWGIDWSTVNQNWKLDLQLIKEGAHLHNAWRVMTTSPTTQDIVFDFLKTMDDTKLLAEPRITVLDGAEATVEVVDSQPYEAGVSDVDSGGVTTSYTSFEFIDIGISLRVTPTINDDGFITMVLRPENSSLLGFYDTGDPEQGDVPIVRRASAETTVRIKDGVTLMIAGLIKEDKTVNESKIPILGDIYGVGKLFRHEGETSRRTETIIFLTPHIVDGDRSMEWDAYSRKQIKGVRE